MQRNSSSKEPLKVLEADPVGGAIERPRTALIVLRRTSSAGALVRGLVERGFSVRVENDVERALEFCRDKPPNLVVVDDLLPAIPGPCFIAELLKISWTTASILIMDKDETSVHEETEGLGILGHMRHLDDTESLDILLEKFMDMGGHDK